MDMICRTIQSEYLFPVPLAWKGDASGRQMTAMWYALHGKWMAASVFGIQALEVMPPGVQYLSTWCTVECLEKQR